MIETRQCLGHDVFWAEGERGAWDGPSREFEPLATVCLKHVRERGCVVSAGGCMGLFPMLWHKHARFDLVVTAEPDPDNFAILETNCVGDHYVCHMAALGERADVVKLYRFDDSNRGMHSITREQQGRETDVRMITVDSMNLARLDLLQLDVEGSELGVLVGADSTIRRCSPVISVEMPSSPVLDLLTHHGYVEVGRASADTVFARS